MNPAEVIMFFLIGLAVLLVIAIGWIAFRKRRKWAVGLTCLLVAGYVGYYAYYPFLKVSIHAEKYEQVSDYLAANYPDRTFTVIPEHYENGYTVGDFDVSDTETSNIGVALRVDKNEAVTIAETENRAEELKMMGAAKVVVATDHQFVDAMAGCEAVIYVAGANPTAGENKNVLVDKDAVANAMAEARNLAIQRVIYLSPARVDESAESQETGGKKIPEELIKLDNFTYTIVQASRGADKPGTGMVSTGSSLDESDEEIPYEDVAAVLVESLTAEATFNQSFELAPGDTPIEQALQKL